MKLKLFLISIFALLALVAYQKNSEYSALKSIDSYESCLTAKGSIIQESYPASCVTRLGTRFTQPIPTLITTPIITQAPPKYVDYTNEFTITVPKNWHKTPTQYWNYNQNEMLKPPEYVQSRDKGKLKIEIGTYDDGSLQALINQRTTTSMDPNETFSISKISVAGQEATLIESKSGFGDNSTVIIQNPYNKHIYVLMFYLDFANYKPLRDQILSTFKFTN